MSEYRVTPSQLTIIYRTTGETCAFWAVRRLRTANIDHFKNHTTAPHYITNLEHSLRIVVLTSHYITLLSNSPSPCKGSSAGDGGGGAWQSVIRHSVGIEKVETEEARGQDFHRMRERFLWTAPNTLSQNRRSFPRKKCILKTLGTTSL